MYVKEELKKFKEEFNNFIPNLRFMYESSEKNISFLDLIITISERKLKTTLQVYRFLSVPTLCLLTPRTH